MNKQGEINELSKLVKPDIGIITNISHAHIQNFSNLKGIAKAKAEIIDNISEQGHMVLNKDDNFFNYFYKKAKFRKLNVISFSLVKKADIYLKKVTKMNNLYKLKIKIKNENYEFYSQFNFKSFIQNILSALAILISLNLKVNKVKKSFTNFSLPQGRGDISKINIYGKKIVLIDESYNANPLSMMSAINNFNK